MVEPTLNRRGIDCSVSPRTETVPGMATSKRRRRCCDVHCNSLWSIWYGVVVLALEAYIVYRAVTKFLIYVALPWPEGKQPYLELNLFVGLVGAGVVLLPFYFISFMFKIGNLANDGYKIGFQMSACAMDPPSILARSNGLIRNSWHHGGPTAPFIHLVSAFCFVIAKVFIDAKLIDVGFLSKDNIWKTDLDFMVPHQDRLRILYFLTGDAVNASSTSTQAPYHHPAAQIRQYLEESEGPWQPFSPEYLNYCLALLVYSVRYPAVFWNTNKGFSFLFSCQLLANSAQNLFSLGGFSIMYKVQLLGPQHVLHRYEPFLLNTPVCALLYILGCVIVTASSCVIYMYGYQKFMAFVECERDKHQILLRGADLRPLHHDGGGGGGGDGGFRTSLWSYFSHCSAMCVLIALSVCSGPLLYDYTLIYKGSLDSTVLTCVVATIVHLFLWIVVWLFLTIKQNWVFKLRVTVGKSVVRSARSIKLLNDVELMRHGGSGGDLRDGKAGGLEGAMMIVAFGKSFTVTDPVPKKLIMNTLARAAIERDKALEDGEDEDASDDVTLMMNPGSTPRMAHSSNGATIRHKVTFEDVELEGMAAVGSSPARRSICGTLVDTRSPRLARSRRDDGATLLDSKEGVTSSSMVTSPFIHGNSCSPRGHVEAPHTSGGLLDHDHLPPPPADSEANHHSLMTVVGNNEGGGVSPNQGATNANSSRFLVSPKPVPRKSGIINPEIQDVHTPRSNRSLDSGLPHDDITQRSDSLSTASSSASPPEHLQQGGHHPLQYQGNHPHHHGERQLEDSSVFDGTKLAAVGGTSANLQAAGRQITPQQWKGYPLQQRCQGQNEAPLAGLEVPNPQPPVGSSTSSTIYASTMMNPDGTVTIRRQTSSRPVVKASEEEDPYGRCMNMRLTSFSEGQMPGGPQGAAPAAGQQQQGNVRDPRIIDLTSSASSNASLQSSIPTAASQPTSVSSTPRQGSPVHQQQPLFHFHGGHQHHPSASNFNTLPAPASSSIPVALDGGGVAAGGPTGGPSMRTPLQAMNPAHNTLPARVGAAAAAPGGVPGPPQGPYTGPTGRHFKPFDHRKMNPMAEIREDPYGGPAAAPQPATTLVVQRSGVASVVTLGPAATSPSLGRAIHSNGAPDSSGLIVHRKNIDVPHMPQELRHTNYFGGNSAPAAVGGPQGQTKLAHPQLVLMDKRDSSASID